MSGEYKKNLGIKVPLLRKYTGWNRINNDNIISAFLDGKNIANGKTKKEVYGKLSSEQSLNKICPDVADFQHAFFPAQFRSVLLWPGKRHPGSPYPRKPVFHLHAGFQIVHP